MAKSLVIRKPGLYCACTMVYGGQDNMFYSHWLHEVLGINSMSKALAIKYLLLNGRSR